MKRWFDLLLAVPGLIAAAPLLLVLGVLIRLDSPGPVFFRQERVGRGGQPFRIHKLRTMRVQNAGAQVTAAGDARITRVGRWLRRSKLDELPQLIDVVLGHMSLVGPRPEVPRYMAQYAPAVRAKILSVRPGITDLAALEFLDEERILAQAADVERAYVEQIMPIKARYYLDYVERQSLALDARIVCKTLAAVLAR